MLKNYFAIAWKNVTSNKTFAAINISGLAAGIAACLLLFVVVTYELGYGRFQPGYKRIYHVVAKQVSEQGFGYDGGIPFPGYDALRVEFPDITVGALFQNYNAQVTVLNKENSNEAVDKKFIEQNTIFFPMNIFFQCFNTNGWRVVHRY